MILAIDYGTKHTGTALFRHGIVSPGATLNSRSEDFFTQIAKIIESEAIETVILGYSEPTDGRLSAVHHQTIRLKKYIENNFTKLEVKMQDETFTSQEAMSLEINLRPKHSKGSKKRQRDLRLHSTAACLILQRYLAAV